MQKYPQNPDVSLDLHGYTTLEAQEALDDIFISPDFSHIRIIVGKGTRSPNGPILPDFVKGYLNARGYDCRPAKFQDGGEGALEVFLR